MAREKRKSKDDATDPQTPADAAQQPQESESMPANDPSQEEQSGGEPKTEWVSKLPEPFGRHRIDLGDGRTLALSRSNRWQQMQIRFVANKEGVDAKPKAEDGDTQWLKEHGWRWRSEEKAWTRQLDKNTDENWAARGNSDAEAHEQFVELANRIRQRNFLDPVSAVISSDRTV